MQANAGKRTFPKCTEGMERSVQLRRGSTYGLPISFVGWGSKEHDFLNMVTYTDKVTGLVHMANIESGFVASRGKEDRILDCRDVMAKTVLPEPILHSKLALS